MRTFRKRGNSRFIQKAAHDDSALNDAIPVRGNHRPGCNHHRSVVRVQQSRQRVVIALKGEDSAVRIADVRNQICDVRVRCGFCVVAVDPHDLARQVQNADKVRIGIDERFVHQVRATKRRVLSLNVSIGVVPCSPVIGKAGQVIDVTSDGIHAAIDVFPSSVMFQPGKRWCHERSLHGPRCGDEKRRQRKQQKCHLATDRHGRKPGAASVI